MSICFSLVIDKLSYKKKLLCRNEIGKIWFLMNQYTHSHFGNDQVLQNKTGL